jgi:23S rRNA (guanosine2251-2'-O)-methyltransferase
MDKPKSNARPNAQPNVKPNTKQGFRKNKNAHSKHPQHHATKASPPDNMIWGVHAVTEAFLNPRREIDAFFVTPVAHEKFQPIIKQAKEKGLKRPEALILERHEFEKKAKLGPDQVHQGLALRAAPLPEIFLSDILTKSSSAPRATLMMLDQVTDPHNIGAIIRSACAFGADALILQSRHAPAMSGALTKIACGGVEHLPIIYVKNLNEAIKDCQEFGFTAYGFDERGDQVLGAFNPASHNLIVLGAEGKGLRHLVGENCDHMVRLDTAQPIASLNVSNAAAVALYDFTKKQGR